MEYAAVSCLGFEVINAPLSVLLPVFFFRVTTDILVNLADLVITENL
jgi:hypothetical protein